jgi:hypothetical protein
MMSVLRYCHLERSPTVGADDESVWWESQGGGAGGPSGGGGNTSVSGVAATAAMTVAEDSPTATLSAAAAALGEGAAPATSATPQNYTTPATRSASFASGNNAGNGGNGIPEALVTPPGENRLCATPEFDYLSQIIIRMYENIDLGKDDPKRFRLEVAFSRGTATDVRLAPPLGPDGEVVHDAYIQTLTDRWPLTDNITETNPPTLQRFENYLWRFAKSTPGFTGQVGGDGLGIAFPAGGDPAAMMGLPPRASQAAVYTDAWGRTTTNPASRQGAPPGVTFGGGDHSGPPTPSKEALLQGGSSGELVPMSSPKHPGDALAGGLFSSRSQSS